jgi:hypothetical protein
MHVVQQKKNHTKSVFVIMTTFKDLNTILNWPELYAPKNTFFFIRDTFTSDGSFLLHHFLNSYLNAQQQQQQQQQDAEETHVKLVSFDHSYFHYSTIELKLNMNLQKEGENGKFVFIDAQQGLLDYGTNTFHDDSTISKTENDDTGTVSLNPLTYMSPIHVRSRGIFPPCPKGLIPWRYNCSTLSSSSSSSPLLLLSSDRAASIFDSLFDTIVLSSKTKCSCLLMDHLDVLLMYTSMHDGTKRELFHFFQKLLVYCHKNECSLVILMHGDDNSAVLNSLANMLEHYANVVFRVGGLPSGYSKDVHGMIQVLFEKWDTGAAASTNDLRLLSRQVLHYKCFEHNVTLFSPGSHADII